MFFGLFSNKISLADCNLLKGFTDWHCHLLPGVDDGVKTMEESLQILSLYEQLGVSEVWCTPHIMEDVPNTTSFLKNRFAALKTAYTGSIQLNLAAENMLDCLFEERLEVDDLLPIGDSGKHLLVETSCFSPPINLYELLIRIQKHGYIPILAHPERYYYMESNEYSRLKEKGVKFQLNLLSLCGGYGSEIQSKANRLLNMKCYDFIGTDVHRTAMFQRIIQSKLTNKQILKIKDIK